MREMKRWEINFYHEKLDALKGERDSTVLDN